MPDREKSFREEDDQDEYGLDDEESVEFDEEEEDE